MADQGHQKGAHTRHVIVSLIAVFLLQSDLCPPPERVRDGPAFVVYPPEISGSSSTALDVVFVGEGFTESSEDVTLFEEKVGEAIQHLSTPPYERCAFNFYSVRLVSKESGASHPRNLPAESKDTPLKAQFGGRFQPEWYLFVDTAEAMYAAALATPDYGLIAVLVNDESYGGLAYWYLPILTASIGCGFENVILHEMGHKFADLGDEYGDNEYDDCCPSECNTKYPNTTVDTARVSLKWPVDESVPIPTDLNVLGQKFSATEDSLKRIVGLWQGALTYNKCVYRPQFTCKMREENKSFCAVCTEAITRTTRAKCSDIPTLDVSVLAQPIQCMVDVLYRIPLSPCLKCLAAADEAAAAEMSFSEDDMARIEIGPLPGVETVNIVASDGLGREIVATATPSPADPSLPQDQSPMFSATFAIEPDVHYYVEFTPAGCKKAYFTLSIRIYVNDKEIQVPPA
jgi:hypothetical protein